MPETFERFTERARTVLSLAREEARRFNHHDIGTEHLLLALVREGEGTAARALREMGVELDEARRAVGAIVGRGGRVTKGEIDFTPQVKEAIELAVAEARRRHHRFIATEHLLLGLLRTGEGSARGVLRRLGVDPERVRSELLRLGVRPQGDEPGAPDAPDTPAPAEDATSGEAPYRPIPSSIASPPPSSAIGTGGRPRRLPDPLALTILALLVAIWIELRRIARHLRRRGPA